MGVDLRSKAIDTSHALRISERATQFIGIFHPAARLKDDVLYTTDFSGLVHCLNAKTGKAYWTYDPLAACWTSPLLVDGKVTIADEDGDIASFRHTENPRFAMKSIQTSDNRTEFMSLDSVWDGELINEVYIGTAIYMNSV